MAKGVALRVKGLRVSIAEKKDTRKTVELHELRLWPPYEAGGFVGGWGGGGG